MKVRGRIVAFDQRTWWGEAAYDLTVVEFHGTSVHGMRTGDVTHEQSLAWFKRAEEIVS